MKRFGEIDLAVKLNYKDLCHIRGSLMVVNMLGRVARDSKKGTIEGRMGREMKE